MSAYKLMFARYLMRLNSIRGRQGLLLFGLLFFVSCSSVGQEILKQSLTEKDYHLWETMSIDKLSESGRWISYLMRYDEHPSMLFLKSTVLGKEYSFPTGSSSTFIKDDYFACLDEANTLHLVDLKRGVEEEISNVKQYSFTDRGRYLLTLEADRGLVIRKPFGQVVEVLPDVTEYKMSSTGNLVMCSSAVANVGRVMLIDLYDNVRVVEITRGADSRYSNFEWDNKESGVVFIKDGDSRVLNYFSFTEDRLSEIGPQITADFPKNYVIGEGGSSLLGISEDGERIFFVSYKDQVTSTKFDGLQIWHGEDAVIYQERAITGDSEFNAAIMVWWPVGGKISKITNKEQPFCYINASMDYAVCYNVLDLGAQYTQDPKVNFMAHNLATGESSFLASNQRLSYGMYGFSPTGKYFTYFNDGAWHIYDFKSQQTFELPRAEFPELIPTGDLENNDVYGVAGWGPEDSYILIYDEFDIWKFTLGNNKVERLTKGRERQRCFRIVKPENSVYYQLNLRGRIDLPYDLKKDVLLSSKDEVTSGYFILEPAGTLREVVLDSMRNTSIATNETQNAFAYISEDYNHPPELKVKVGSKKSKRIVQSNVQHYFYAWGKQETITYKNRDGKKLKGLLYYPSNFDSRKSYPMVVHIYDSQHYLQHYYLNPSEYNMTGFNVANLVAEGYFVLLPDITYDIGNPGLSATDCVVAAVAKAVEYSYVDPQKIALVGHSFGGYETNFIITQTNLFACAISGASIADFPGWYLSIGWNDGNPELWRFESQQFRMGKSLFEDFDGYLKNSPVTHAKNITTPILLWAGENDRQVHYDQSIAFYLALRRLNKKQILLIYPGEGHAFTNPKNKKDLTTKLLDWLNFYLKGSAPQAWMTDVKDKFLNKT